MMKKKFILAIIACALLMIFAFALCACDKGEAHTIKFVLNNGEADVVWREGDPIPSPSRGSDVFLGWCYDTELTEEAYLDDILSEGLSGDLTLYAKWRVVEGSEAN